MKYDILNLKAQKAGQIELSEDVFGVQPRVDILSRVIQWQLAKRRSGSHKTKQVADVRGSTKKIYRQKGTGNARHGSKRQVQFRGGCVVFGPLVRSHAYSLPKKIRKLGLKIALSSKVSSGELVILDSFELSTHKTKELKSVLQVLNINNALIVDKLHTPESNLYKASGNIHNVDILPQFAANVYDIMRKDKLVVTVEAVKALEERLK